MMTSQVKWHTLFVILLAGILAIIIQLSLPGVVPASKHEQNTPNSDLEPWAYLPFIAKPYPVGPIIIPHNGAYLGAHIGDLPASYSDSLIEIEGFETMVGRRLAIVNRFWSMTIDDGQYTDFDWLNLEELFTDGRILMISWGAEDWNTTTQESNGPIHYQEIITGEFDYVIRPAAQYAAKFGQPIFMRWCWEMNGDWYPCNAQNAFGPNGTQSWRETDDQYGYFGDPDKADGPERFVATWRHIHNIFDEEGADNVIWVWSPNWQSFPSDTPWSTFSEYYPGDDQVDWIGTSIYCWDSSSCLSFGEMLTNQGDSETSIAGFYALHSDKPVMIAEIGCAEIGGNKPQWISNAYQSVREQYPYIKAIAWFSISKEREWQVDSSEASLNAFINAISDSYYLDRVILSTR